MPKVTVIVPVFNAELYLDECLESVLGQSLDDIEVVCIDDGSDDPSPQLLSAWAARDERVHVVTQANAGPGAARNAGLAIASGEYLCFVDNDDILLPGALQELYDRASANELDVLYYDASPFCSDTELEPEFKRFEAYYRRSRSYEGVMPGRELMAQMADNADLRPAVWSVLVRSAYCRSIGLRFPEGILHEDNLFSFLCGIQAERAEYLRKVFYRRRVRKNSIMTMAKVDAHFAGFFVTCVEMLRYLTHSNLDQRTMAMGSKLCAQMYQQAIDVYSEIPGSTRARVVNGGSSPEALVLGRILVRDADSVTRARRLGDSLETCENDLAALQGEVESRTIEFEATIAELEAQLAHTQSRLKKSKKRLKKIKQSRTYRFAQTIRKVVRFGR